MSMERVVDQLSRASVRDHRPPDGVIDWPEHLEAEQWCMSPELVSLHGTALWDALGEEQRRRLAFFEAVNFFSLNIHGERMLLQGVAARLYRPHLAHVARYLHHLIDEENKHSSWFAGFCTRYAGTIYPDRKLVGSPGSDDHAASDFLFFAKVAIFEEIVDAYNRTMAADQRLAPVARQINHYHHLDERRHLAFGRRLATELFERGVATWSPETLAFVREHLDQFLHATWQEYYNPRAYLDAGIDDAWAVRENAWHHRAARRHRLAFSAGAVTFLVRAGVIDGEPAWLRMEGADDAA